MRQVARCEWANGEPVISVRLVPLSVDSFLAKPKGAGNVLRIVYEDGSETRLTGLGAGREPTAESVMSDVEQIEAMRVRV